MTSRKRAGRCWPYSDEELTGRSAAAAGTAGRIARGILDAGGRMASDGTEAGSTGLSSMAIDESLRMTQDENRCRDTVGLVLTFLQNVIESFIDYLDYRLG